MPTIEQSRKHAVKDNLRARKLSDTEYTVTNAKRGSTYRVRLLGTAWVCECPWQTKGTTGGFCKHVVRVMDKINGCVECGGHNDIAYKRDTGEPICAECRAYNKVM